MKTGEIKQLFDHFETLKVLVIGDVMIDAYLWGKVERISPEAPVPVVSVTHRENRLGGAANVGLNLKSLGAIPLMCSVIGNDEKGKLFLELMQKEGLSTQGIMSHPSRKTTVKSRVISHGQHLLRVDDEMDSNLPEDTANQFSQHILSLLKSEKPNAIVFEDYDKGCLSKSTIKQIVDEANKMNIPTLVDPKKRNFLHYRGVTLFKPNFKELTEGMKLEISKSDFDQIEKASAKFRLDMNIKYTLITLSEHGMYIGGSECSHHLPAEIRDIADVSGAGDTVVSVASLCLASGITPYQLAAIANLAGGLVCEKVGVVPIDKEQLKNECIHFFQSK